jgi:hypothetical protein
VSKLLARPLAVEFLEIAGGDVVEAGVAKDVGADVFIGVEQMAAAADDNGDFAFVVDALGDAGEDDGFFGRDDRRRGLQEDYRILRRRAAHFGGVVDVILADADDFRGDGGREEFYGVERPFVAGEFACAPEFAAEFVNGVGFNDAVAHVRVGFAGRTGDVGSSEFERLEAAKFHDLGFMVKVSWLLMKMIRAAAARGNRVLARLETHADHPGADGGYTVDDGAFDERFKRTA